MKYLLALLLAFTSLAQAQSLGTLIHDGPATPEQISLYLPITGNPAQTATATCRYKVTGVAAWSTCHPLYRIRPTLTLAPSSGTVDDAFAWPIIDLRPGTSYDVEVTVVGAGIDGVRTLTHRTRDLPLPAGIPNKTITAGSSAATIQTAFNGLVAGDVLQFENGSYTVSSLDLDGISGTVGSPIYIRGASRAGVILTDTTDRVLYILDSHHIIIENMTLVGSGVDSGTDSLSKGIEFFSATPGQTRITVRNVTMTGVDKGIVAGAEIEEFLAYNNTFAGNNTWTKETTPGTRDIDANLTWNDDGIRLPGFGNCAFQNTLSGFGDTFSYTFTDGTPSIGVHFYRNDVLMGGDDGTEVDDAQRNLSFYDNRLRNTMTFTSLDALHGGPLLVARNIAINIGRRPHKWNSQNSGQFLYNNTVVMTTMRAEFLIPDSPAEAGWYQPNNGAQNSYGYRNNLLVYRGVGDSTLFLESLGHNPIDFDHNAYYPNREFTWQPNDFANLAAAYAGLPATTPVFSGHTKRHEADVITISNPWTDTITLGSDYHTEVTTAYVPVLSAGTAPKNAGVAIPNITDGFTGAAPDMGAVIEGRPSVIYGNTVPAYVSARAVGDWYRIPNSDIRTVNPATLPAPGSPRSKVDVWNSFVVDPRTSILYSAGNGGHTDYSGNEVDLFHLNREVPAWEERLAPTPAASVTTNADYYLDGRPASRHSYYGATLDEWNNRVMLFTGARYQDGNGTGTTDSYNISSNSYSAAATHPDMHATLNAADVAWTLDPSTGNVYGLKDSLFRLWNRSSNTWTTPAPSGTVPNLSRIASAFDTTRGRILYLGSNSGGTDFAHTYTVATNTFANVISSVTGASATAVLDSTQGSMIYVRELDKYLVRAKAAGGAVYQVDAATFEATPFTTTGGDDIPVVSTGVYNRFLYVPDLGGVVYYPSAFTTGMDVWFLKVHEVVEQAAAAADPVIRIKIRVAEQDAANDEMYDARQAVGW